MEIKRLFNIKRIIVALVVIALGVGGYLYWRNLGYYPSTDDAYIRAHVVHIAAQVSGPVSNVYVKENQFVKQGELLFDIDPAPFRIALERAQAQLDITKQEVSASEAAVHVAQAQVEEKQSQFIDARDNNRRILALVAKGQQPKSAGDNARAALQTAKAALAAAKSELIEAKSNLGLSGAGNARLRAVESAIAQAQLDLQHTKITAPADGIVSNVNIRPGAMVQVGMSLFALVENGYWWVDANYKETDLLRIKSGQPADITVDIYPGHHFKGVVESVSPASGVAFSLLPPENATGNWVKVTQRFPVRVHILNSNLHFPLRVGASSHVVINTLSTMSN